MARGRFVSGKIIVDRKVHDLSSDTCRLAYTWMIPLADKEGRVTGEPEMLLSQIFPRRRDVSANDMQGFIDEWVQAGFIFVYLGKDGDKVIQLVNFEKHQIGLRKDREPDSIFDNPEDCRIIAGRLPEENPVKLIKDKLSEGEESPVYMLFSAFVTGFKRQPYSNEQDKWIKELSIMASEGVKPEDIKQAFVELDGRYSITSPKSIKTAAITCMKKRLNPKPKGKNEKSLDDLKFDNV
jgi:hypothetical protein